MRKILYITILSVLSLFLVTCDPGVTDDFGCCFARIKSFFPQAVLFDIKAVNEMENPVDIKIRHKYFFLSGSVENDFTGDWSSPYNLKSGETASVGVEQAKRWDADSSWYDEGFILLDEDSDYYRFKNRTWFYSSFEINVVTDAGTFNIPGYTYSSDFMDGTKRKSYGLSISAWGICTLELNGHKEDLNKKYCTCGGCSCGLYDCSYNPPKENLSGFSLPMNLTIKPDGTYTLEFGEVQSN